MRSVNPGEVWMIDFGMAAKVRPALLLTGEPAADELDLVTVLLHTTALRGNRWELAIDRPFLKPGAFHLQQVQTISTVKLERRLGVLSGEEMNRVLFPLPKLSTKIAAACNGLPPQKRTQQTISLRSDFGTQLTSCARIRG